MKTKARGFGANPKGRKVLVSEVAMSRLVHKAWVMQHVCGALLGRLNDVDPAFPHIKIAEAAITALVVADEYLDAMSDQEEQEAISQFIDSMTSDGTLSFLIIHKKDAWPQVVEPDAEAYDDTDSDAFFNDNEILYP